MIEAPEESEPVTASVPADADPAAPLVEMIASNVVVVNRRVPSVGSMSVIDEIYEFAERLRAGSTLRVGSAK
jgi:hypothetical protein